MANEYNLKPVRTKSEARERGKKGGKASGEARRLKANFRKTLNLLLTTEIDSPEWTPALEALGLKSTLESAMLAAMIKEALAGNVKAAYFVAQYAGQSEKPDEDIRNREADIELKEARKRSMESNTPEKHNIDDSIKEMEAYFENLKTGDSESSVEGTL